LAASLNVAPQGKASIYKWRREQRRGWREGSNGGFNSRDQIERFQGKDLRLHVSCGHGHNPQAADSRMFFGYLWDMNATPHYVPLGIFLALSSFKTSTC
jgi:hypothetical protein